MSNFTDFFPAAGGGGGIPKYQDFTSSGTFTPSAALIAAGGRVAYLAVGGGQRGESNQNARGGAGGQVKWGFATLTGTTGCAVTIGAGGTSDGSNGGNTTIAFNSAGGTAITSYGGVGGPRSEDGTNFGANMYRGQGGVGGGASSGAFGFGAGGAAQENGTYFAAGTSSPGANTGSGSKEGNNAAAGFVRITWFE